MRSKHMKDYHILRRKSPFPWWISTDFINVSWQRCLCEAMQNTFLPARLKMYMRRDQGLLPYEDSSKVRQFIQECI